MERDRERDLEEPQGEQAGPAERHEARSEADDRERQTDDALASQLQHGFHQENKRAGGQRKRQPVEIKGLRKLAVQEMMQRPRSPAKEAGQTSSGPAGSAKRKP